jgi:iron complex transport system permease protein
MAGYGSSLSALFLAVLCGLYFGDMKVAVGDLLGILLSGPSATDEPIKTALIWQFRIPRVLSAAMSGAILATGGAIFQAALRNPLSEPYTLGVASGASFGASLAIFAGAKFVMPFAFAGSALALLAVLSIGEKNGGDDVSGVILAGVIVASVMGAGQTLIRSIAGQKLEAMVIWIMGSFSAATRTDLPFLGLACTITLLICVSYMPELDIMASGRDGAHIGIDVKTTRLVMLSGVSLAVSIVVSRFGVIGFVGLVAPHIFRILFGPSHGTLLPLSAIGGAALMVAADAIAKSLSELPVGVLTVLLGGPFFCFILIKRKT